MHVPGRSIVDSAVKVPTGLHADLLVFMFMYVSIYVYTKYMYNPITHGKVKDVEVRDADGKRACGSVLMHLWEQRN